MAPVPHSSSEDVQESISPFTEYLNSEKHSDVLVTVEGETFHCHKVILAKSFPYFDGALNFDISHAVVDLKEDISASGFKEILRWAYTGEYTISVGNVADLIEASCFLHVDSVRNRCVKYLTNAGTKDSLIDIFFFTFKYDLNKIAGTIRNYIMANLKECVKMPRFVNMTALELKSMLFFEKSLPKKVLENEEIATIHPKLILTAILEWTFSGENRLTEATDLLNSFDLMMIRKDDIGEVCEKYEHIIEDNQVVFSPLLLRLSQDDSLSQSYNPKPANEEMNLYVASVAIDYVTVNSYSLKNSVWIPLVSDDGLMKAMNHFSQAHNERIINFGVYGGSAYFLTSKSTPSGISYHIRKLQRKLDAGAISYYSNWVNIPSLTDQNITWIDIMKNKAEEFTVMFTVKDELNFISYISGWSNRGWTTKRVPNNEKYHFLLRYADNRAGKPTTLCSVPITKIPQIPNFDAYYHAITAVPSSNDEIYVFTYQRPPNGFVLDINRMTWSPLPAIPNNKDRRSIKLAANVCGRIIVILMSKQTFELDRNTKSWIELANIPNEAADRHLAICY